MRDCLGLPPISSSKSSNHGHLQGPLPSQLSFSCTPLRLSECRSHVDQQQPSSTAVCKERDKTPESGKQHMQKLQDTIYVSLPARYDEHERERERKIPNTPNRQIDHNGSMDVCKLTFPLTNIQTPNKFNSRIEVNLSLNKHVPLSRDKNVTTSRTGHTHLPISFLQAVHFHTALFL